MFCGKCGQQLGETSGRFCYQCGAELNLEVPPASPTWKQMILIWWALTWRSILTSFACAMVLGVLGGILAVLFDPGPGKGAEYGRLLGTFGAIPGLFLALKWMLNRRIGDFTLVAKFHQIHRPALR